MLETLYPDALDTNVSLGEPNNGAGSVLAADADMGDEVLLMATATLPASGVVRINDELIAYVEKTPTQIGSIANPAVRGFGGTAAAEHETGDSVRNVITAQHFLALRDAVLALEVRVGIEPAAGAERVGRVQLVPTDEGPRALVETTAIEAESVVMLTGQDADASGNLYVIARVPGESFTIASENGAASGFVGWEIR